MGSISTAERAVPVKLMYIIKAVDGHAWKRSNIWLSSVAEALQDLHQNVGDLSFFAFCRHYGMHVVPCRPSMPVAQGVGFILGLIGVLG
jgi:hypothetical protein